MNAMDIIGLIGSSYQDDYDGFVALKSVIFTEPSLEDINSIIVPELKKYTYDSGIFLGLVRCELQMVMAC